MGPTGIDAGAFRAAQHRNWDAAAAGWRAYSAFNRAADGHISARLVALAGVRPGSRVLDIAAGVGEPALTAARAAGPDGQVVATDISAEMLAFARERAEEAGLANVELLQSDASSLDLPPASFDAAVSRWGIIFEPDGEAVAARVRGFLRPGRRMAISSWGEPDEVPLLSIAFRTTMRRFGVPPAPPGTPGPLSRPTPAALGALLEGGGFTDVAVEQDEVVFEFEDPGQYTAYVRAMAAPVRAMIAEHAGDAQDEAWDAITQAAKEVAGGWKRLRLANVVLLASGTA